MLEAVAKGDTVAPAPAPSHVDSRGAVGIPARWDHLIRGALQEVAASDAAERATDDSELAVGGQSPAN